MSLALNIRASFVSFVQILLTRTSCVSLSVSRVNIFTATLAFFNKPNLRVVSQNFLNLVGLKRVFERYFVNRVSQPDDAAKPHPSSPLRRWLYSCRQHKPRRLRLQAPARAGFRSTQDLHPITSRLVSLP